MAKILPTVSTPYPGSVPKVTLKFDQRGVLRARFHETRTVRYFDLNTDPTELQNYLRHLGWLTADETIASIEKPGEGNMNVVLRLRTDRRSLILKQSRPYVQKYRQLAAPLDRIDVEQRFYHAVEGTATKQHLPAVLAYAAAEHLLLLEDLGASSDLTALYAERAVSDELLNTLVRLLADIHRSVPPADFPENRALRELNHQHIFVLPFLADNGFALEDVQPGLEELAAPFKSDDGLKKIVAELGDRYLRAGDTLLHGDYYPGSWLRTERGVYVIDPEFSFVGFREYDLGVMVAHTYLATHDATAVERVLNAYDLDCDAQRVRQMAGIEVVRRLIGLAQLPLERSLAEKGTLLAQARRWIME